MTGLIYVKFVPNIFQIFQIFELEMCQSSHWLLVNILIAVSNSQKS